MGRPVTKAVLAQLSFISVWIPGAPAPAVGPVTVTRQSSSNAYVVSDGTHEGICFLINGPGPVTASGYAIMGALPFGSATVQYVYILEQNQVKTFQDNDYLWTIGATTAAGQAQIGNV
jgi:hypothetical protein